MCGNNLKKHIMTFLCLALTMCLMSGAAISHAQSDTSVHYHAMDRALSENNDDEALKHFYLLVSTGVSILELGELVKIKPLSNKTYAGVCSVFERIGEKANGIYTVRYIFRSKDADDVVQKRCLAVLEKWGDQEITSDLIGIFVDKKREINLRIVAAKALKELAPDRAKEQFIKILDSPDEMLIHYKSVQYLSGFNTPEVSSAIEKHILNPNASELSRERGIFSFVSVENKRYKDEPSHLATAKKRAGTVVGMMGRLFEQTSIPDPVAERAIKILSSPGVANDGGKTLLKHISESSKSENVRSAAVHALTIPEGHPYDNNLPE